MRVRDLHVLPKFSDGWSYLYVEHCRIDQDARAVAIHDESGKVPVPCANLALLMLGPGVAITHAAISVLADHGCLVAWCGEGGVRFYAVGMGETRSAANFLHQARVWADAAMRLKVVRNLYQLRFDETFDPELSLRQIRGMEGVRVRDAYARAARETGVPWSGRSYRRDKWTDADPVNRALSAANSCLYGICHAAIASAGFSPALGFIHTGKMLSFVYDVADLYKAELTIPTAFRAAAEENNGLERRVRILCRDLFVSTRLLERIIPDIQTVLMSPKKGETSDGPFDQDAAAPGALWDPVTGEVEGGCAYPLENDETEADDDGSDP
ncbi:MAG TPA: type I-E CRISPR-associated endonuclease Cas1e [Acidobacteriota bacterium]|nr:type I-E CRISPR-associated endonuclease Cas1e [Acidobacteriota bacterium]HQG93343.1 type I-E CRISPR-associated endonuclease Cas1e [Acidobacteriota bacterium]HQK76421.1 type I-E CRISPR-associated endonuclease Cas1e [Candidatus Hydrogenedentota bacterium]